MYQLAPLYGNDLLETLKPVDIVPDAALVGKNTHVLQRFDVIVPRFSKVVGYATMHERTVGELVLIRRTCDYHKVLGQAADFVTRPELRADLEALQSSDLLGSEMGPLLWKGKDSANFLIHLRLLRLSKIRGHN